MPNKTIIAVDDSRVVLQQVTLALQAEFEVIEALDGIDGLEKLGHHPNAALMICDINMPRMNGLEMVETVRGNPVYSKLPLVMLTSEAKAGLLERVMNAGAKGWLTKPFRPEMVLAVARKLTEGEGAGSGIASSSGGLPCAMASPFIPKKIIVVDDSRTVRQEVAMALSTDFVIVEAQDGVDGLEKLGHHRDAGLMICDINMPRMNGLEMIEAVRRDPAHDMLPLMMLSTEGQADWINRARKAGAKAWVIKPFKPALLLAAAKKLTQALTGSSQ